MHVAPPNSILESIKHEKLRTWDKMQPPIATRQYSWQARLRLKRSAKTPTTKAVSTPARYPAASNWFTWTLSSKCTSGKRKINGHCNHSPSVHRYHAIRNRHCSCVASRLKADGRYKSQERYSTHRVQAENNPTQAHSCGIIW
mmetsp:Transcript_15145/g.37664  ORF Transcript_15145/g.37664 Transcript_15145/m.37664 type:complete len:143 (-) Transcript_15145:234-662(-)